jgi:hypothetical protein
MSKLFFKQKIPAHQFGFKLQKDRIAVIEDGWAYIYETLTKSLIEAKNEALALFLEDHKGDGLTMTGKQGIYYINSK